MEGIFVFLIIVVNAFADLVGRGTRGDEGSFQARSPRVKSQHDLADIAGDDDVDLVIVHGALEGADGIRGGRMVVVSDDFYLAPVDAALGVNLLGRHLRGLRD